MPVESQAVVTQRSILGAPRFRFHDTYLDYSGLNWDFRVKYEELPAPTQFKRSAIRHWSVKAVAPYLCLLALVLLLRDRSPHYGPAGLRWLLWSGGGVVAAIMATYAALSYLTRREFTLIPTPSGSIMVLRDKHHDAVLARLQAERLEKLRRFASPDPANSPQEELTKLQWLRDEGAITAEECARFSAQTVA